MGSYRETNRQRVSAAGSRGCVPGITGRVVQAKHGCLAWPRHGKSSLNECCVSETGGITFRKSAVKAGGRPFGRFPPRITCFSSCFGEA